MTTNNHPAHGPVSLDRLHQISEILSKAAAQSDGGNLGYAMADAVKVIDGAIAEFGAEPVPFDALRDAVAEVSGGPVMEWGDIYKGHQAVPFINFNSLARIVDKFRTFPPAPVVPEEITSASAPEVFEIAAEAERLGLRGTYASYAVGWNACRAAMLQAGNSPVTPDGLALVPKRLTAENGAKGVLSGEFSETKFINCPECFGDDECETCDGSGRIEITVPVSWTNIKAIWAKGVEHFEAAPRQENV
ncbi:hypothetical protein RQM69_10705 [Citrobacter freundii]|uniref:hypothetical protein n=1 Tax=Citrobacter freundii TaxID=546 RepID=UPI0028BF09DE|nr:hypothetical protein [Citrobacter freundii]MDT7360433.1 hypothetical protein [Citrobacter freundii]